MQSLFFEGLYAKSIAVVAVAFFGSTYPSESAASSPGVRSTKVTAAVSLAATVIAAPARPGRSFGVQVLAVADTIAAKAGAKGQFACADRCCPWPEWLDDFFRRP